MKETINRIAPYFPWVGLLLIVAGLVNTGIVRRLDMTGNLLLGIGAILLLLFAILRPDIIRRIASGRRARFGLTTVLSILFFTAIMILVYYIAYQNQDWRIDLTETDEFTPLAETLSLLESVDEPLRVLGFFTAAQQAQEDRAEQILKNLQSVNDFIDYEFHDPEANPILAEPYDLNFPGTLVFIRGDGEDEVFSKANTISEQEIHEALVRVLNPVDKKAYFVTGHGEGDIQAGDDAGLALIVGFLEDNGWTVDSVSLFTSGAVPADAALIAVVDQQAPMFPEEVGAIRDYLDAGGSLLIARDIIDTEGRLLAENDDMTIMLLDDWGLRIRPDIIIEVLLAQANQAYLDLTFLGATYGTSPIVTADVQTLGTAYSGARSISTQPVDGVTQITLVSTSQDSWGEMDYQSLSDGRPQADPGQDAVGPLPLAVSAENTLTGGRVVVFGDTDVLLNRGIFQQANYLMVSNAFNWLVDDEVSINLTPRDTVQRQVVVPDAQLRFLRLISIWLGPVLMLAIGAVVWYTRRQRR